jgi:hypothetical protein
VTYTLAYCGRKKYYVTRRLSNFFECCKQCTMLLSFSLEMHRNRLDLCLAVTLDLSKLAPSGRGYKTFLLP